MRSDHLRSWRRSLSILGFVLGVFPVAAQPRFNLIPLDAVWRYSAVSNDLGTAWRTGNYDDMAAGWQSGPQLFGDDPNSYPLAFASPLPVPHPITMYFRHRFNFIENPLRVTLVASNLVEDGAVFYLNGVRVGDIRVPNPDPVFATSATRAPEPHPGWEIIEFVPANLIQGENVLAVELHQSGADSVDAAMAVVLDAIMPAPLVITNEPQDQTVGIDSVAMLAVGVSGSNPRYQWFKDDVMIGAATGSTYSIQAAQPGHTGSYFVVVSNVLGSVTSRVARVTVVPDTVGPELLTAVYSEPDSALDRSTLMLSFSESVEAASARELSNYSLTLAGINQSIVITQAQSSVRQVRLSLAESLQPDLRYILAVDRVRDLHGNPIAPSSRVAVAFYGTFVPMNAEWRWDASGLDLGTDWRQRGYDDSAWATGRALFYFGFDLLEMPCDGNRNTVVPAGVTTYYFRTHFAVENTTGRGALRLEQVVDDGAVFYVNGVEVSRSRMPAGAISASTRAATAVAQVACDFFNALVTNLVSGDNVLSVEVHQASPDGGDVLFGAELAAAVQPAFPELFDLNIRHAALPATLTLEWRPHSAILQSAHSPLGPWDDLRGSSPFFMRATNAAVFYRLRSQ